MKTQNLNLDDFNNAKISNPIYIAGVDGDEGGIDRETSPPQNGNPAN